MTVLGLAIVLLLQIHQVTGYGQGAPPSTCLTQYPKHNGAYAQTTPSPFRVTFDPPAYRPGEDVKIEIVEETGAEFVGFQMAARRLTGNTQEIVGRFVNLPDKIRTNNCYGGYQNMMSHANNEAVTNITVTWRPPSENVGEVSFITTFVKSYNVFWHGVRINLQVDSTDPVQPAKYPAIPLAPLTKSINFDDCGHSKGCFYYPRICSGSDCTAAATFTHRKSTNDFLFELYLDKSDADYVSIGFSDDSNMGNDVTVTCTAGAGQLSVQEGINPGKYNQRFLNTFSSGHELRHVDGKMHCRFVIPEEFAVYKVDQSATDSFVYATTQWDLRKDWHLFVAWGKTMPDTSVISSHTEHPAMSMEKIDFTETIISYSTSFQVNVQVHATLMTVAWILFAGIATVISRHYRDWMKKSAMCGSPIWFQLHRLFAVLIVILTLIGIIIIFAHFGSEIRDVSTPHSYVGLAVVACMGLQVICGILRPHLEHSLRPVFNIGHRLMGFATHILAAATMFLAYEIKYINSDMREVGIIVLSVWVGVQVFWHFMFEIIKRYRSKSGSNSYSIDDNDLKPEETSKNSDDCPHGTTLVTYILTLMGITAGAILPIYIY